MKKLIAFTTSLLASVPALVSAQQLVDINTAAQKATNIGNLITQIAISLAVLWIIVSVVRFLVVSGTDEEGRKKGKESIMYGVIALFLIFSIWGLVSLLTNTFQFGQNNKPTDKINNIQLPNPVYVP